LCYIVNILFDTLNIAFFVNLIYKYRYMKHTKPPKIAIIGSGPAGLTAAIYTSRAGLDTTVYTGDQPGGQLTTTTEIDNFPGFENGIMGPQLMLNMQKQAERFGALIVSANVKSIQYTKSDSEQFSLEVEAKQENYNSVIIATGAKARYLGIEGEQNFIGRGYHTCATCDGFFYKGRVVAVVGGGDSAMEEASYLAKLASKVYLIHRSDSYKASKIMQDRVAKTTNIEKLEFKTVTKFLTDSEGEFSGVVLQDTNSQLQSELAIDGLFVAVGHIPNSQFINSLKLDQDEIGYLIPQSRLSPMDRTSKYSTATKIEGLFVAGDIEDSVYRQAITAAGDGCKAAMDVEKWLEQ
jgi:thioredoxin reductase (NADPH)